MKIITIIPAYNEIDIIEEVIEHLLSQKLEIIVLDNFSNDGTFEICKKYSDQGLLKVHKFESKTFDVQLNNRILYDLAIKEGAEWVIACAADEILETGIKNSTLREEIEKAAKEGCNLIQFDRFDFFLTDNDNETAKSVTEKLTYYSCQGEHVYRAWECIPGIDLEAGGSHYPYFPGGEGYKIYPKKFVMRHYPFRSIQQAERKAKERTRGREKSKKSDKPVNLHYQSIQKSLSKIKISHKKLIKYNGDGKWNLERVHCPFTGYSAPTRDMLFTDDGAIKVKKRTTGDYKTLLSQKESKMIALRLLRRLDKTLISLNKKLGRAETTSKNN